MSNDPKVAERLAREWPKKCGCGRVYTREEWNQLPIGYEQHDVFGRHEGRHCSCGSTLQVVLEIYDLGKE